MVVYPEDFDPDEQAELDAVSDKLSRERMAKVLSLTVITGSGPVVQKESLFKRWTSAFPRRFLQRVGRLLSYGLLISEFSV